ncbi:hypothetical protein GCM10022242_02120 [Nocardioides panacisoli]|uniref:ABC transporter permease n=2 Tax=Nocardioides panacisoli TaxID=627624 RepID=A0ABP7HU19_9ACTN
MLSAMAHTSTEAPDARTISRYGLIIAAVGIGVQLVLGVYYLAMAHSPQPHDLPVGVVGSAQQQAQVTDRLEQGGDFKVEAYDGAAGLVQAIKQRDAYGGVVFKGRVPTLYVASAAGPSVANLFRRSFTEAYEQELGKQVKQIVAAGSPVPAATAARLAAPPAVKDVVPLPADDSAGSSLGFVIQALCLGGSIASLALGRLGRLTQRSPKRGAGHASLLVVYALGSGAVALVAMAVFGVGDDAHHLTLFGGLALISLAVTASTAACVALFGPVGSLVGGLYFTVGLVISGSSIVPEMLPTLGKAIGQLLPPGAGATVARDATYFPDASTAGPFVVLGLYSVIGLAVILVTNTAANRSRYTWWLRRHAASGVPAASPSPPPER